MKGQDTYRGWAIYYDPPPIPCRDFDWHAIGPNYDASWEGEEDGYVDNGEKALAATREALIQEIDNWFDEQSDSGSDPTGEDPKGLSAPASQSGPKGIAQNTPPEPCPKSY